MAQEVVWWAWEVVWWAWAWEVVWWAWEVVWWVWEVVVSAWEVAMVQELAKYHEKMGTQQAVQRQWTEVHVEVLSAHHSSELHHHASRAQQGARGYPQQGA
jgi:hypothetical protein